MHLQTVFCISICYSTISNKELHLHSELRVLLTYPLALGLQELHDLMDGHGLRRTSTVGLDGLSDR
jgi:hypothetical protein